MNYCITIIAVLLLSGCSFPTATTEATYFDKSGTQATYKSGKDQTDFHVRYEFDLETGRVKSADISVGKSGTPEAAIAAQAAANLKLIELLGAALKSGGKGF